MNEEKNKEEKKVIELSNSEVNDLLISLKYSEYWPAIELYNNFLINKCDAVLISIDPFKNPTEVARNQGFRSAVSYLKAHIETEENKRREQESESSKKED